MVYFIVNSKFLNYCFLFALFSFCFVQLQAQTKTTEGFANNNGVRIYYRTFGEGKPLLIINGGPGMNSEGFADLAIRLSENYKTIIFDQRGTGKSVLPVINHQTIKMDLMVEDLEVLRKALHISEWNILGHSFGGMLVSYYATKHPEKITSIILSSSGGIDLELTEYVSATINSKLSSKAQDSINSWNRRISEGDTSMNAKMNRGRLMAPAYVYNSKYYNQIGERLAQGNSTINSLVWQDLRSINYDCTNGLTGFNKPVLIIQGKQDIILEKTAIKASRVFRNSKLVLLNNCIHYGWLDQPTNYFTEINKFLQKSFN